MELSEKYGLHGKGTPTSQYRRALERIEGRIRTSPDELASKARGALVSVFGESASPSFDVYVPASASFLSEHCDYFNGFALAVPVPVGTAIALRVRSDASEFIPPAEGVAFSVRLGVRSDVLSNDDFWATCLRRLLSRLPLRRQGVAELQIAAADSLPQGLSLLYGASLLVGLCHAFTSAKLLRKVQHKTLTMCHEVLTEHLSLPIGVTPTLAANAGASDQITLLDTETFESTGIELPDHSRLGWGLIDAGAIYSDEAAFVEKTKSKTKAIVQILQNNGFAEISSMREIEHRDLQRVLRLLPEELVPLARFLVMENSRVQKIVAAIRHSDWQILGALLMMSHAALRDDLMRTKEEVNYVVNEADRVEGIYGARQIGRGDHGHVICVGQPFAIPPFLDQVAAGFEARFGSKPQTMLL